MFAGNEAVSWIVMTKPLRIYEEELEEFRQIKDDHGNPITNNCRPVQDLNGRKIYTNY